jgi:hypothetical protein
MLAIALVCWAGVPVVASAQAAGGKYTISIAAMLLAEPGIETPLPIQIAPGDDLPKNSFIRIRGLPPTATLSEGHVIAAGSWAVPLSALPTLKLAAPISNTSKSELTVALVGIDGNVWAEAKSTLAVIPASSLPLGKQGPQTPPRATAAAGPPQPDPSNSVTRPGASGAGAASAPPSTPILTPQDNERALGLVAKGDEMLEEGDVASARLYYQRAVDLGLAKAAVALAETYDPNELSRWPVAGLQPDVATARRWYEHALQLGAPEANDRLQRLTSR